MRKSIQGQVKKVKKGQIFIFFENKDMFLKQNLLNIHFGDQNLSYRVETLHTGWKSLALQHIFRFFENFENFGFCDHFSKRSDFWNFWGQKSKI